MLPLLLLPLLLLLLLMMLVFFLPSSLHVHHLSKAHAILTSCNIPMMMNSVKNARKYFNCTRWKWLAHTVATLKQRQPLVSSLNIFFVVRKLKICTMHIAQCWFFSFCLSPRLPKGCMSSRNSQQMLKQWNTFCVQFAPVVKAARTKGLKLIFPPLHRFDLFLIKIELWKAFGVEQSYPLILTHLNAI